MASACVNQILDSSSPSSFGWFSPRISFSRDFPVNQEQQQQQPHSHSLLEDDSCFDFEFRPVGGELKKMHSADELFFDGKLMPLHLSETSKEEEQEDQDQDKKAQESQQESGAEGDGKVIINEIFNNKNSTSPKAPKCAGGWKEFLGLKKSDKSKSTTTTSSKSLKFFLNRNSKTDSSSSSMNLPLLDSEIEQEPPSISSSSRLSLSSSSSSGPDHEDLPLPRLSLDSEKSTLPKVKLTKQLKAKGKTISTNSSSRANARVGRSVARRTSSSTSSSRGVSVDSPRMNSSGKIVFHSLERSSSSPSSFNGGPRMKARGMERSYSANVRIRPVLNVPVCSSLRVSKNGSVFGFGQLFSSSSQKRDGNGCNRNQSMRRNGSGNNR